MAEPAIRKRGLGPSLKVFIPNVRGLTNHQLVANSPTKVAATKPSVTGPTNFKMRVQRSLAFELYSKGKEKKLTMGRDRGCSKRSRGSWNSLSS